MADERVVFAGVVLTGGRSERMGRDKALLPVDGVAMAVRVAQALERAGATTVTCIGGDVEALEALGLDAVADDHEGVGPLGGVVVALGRSPQPSITVVAPCDVIDPEPAAFAALARALAAAGGATVAVPVVDGVWRPLPCALRASARPTVEEAFVQGERALHRAFAALERVEVDAGRFADADSPEDLRGRR